MTPPRPVSMSPTREILSSNREWTIVYDQPVSLTYELVWLLSTVCVHVIVLQFRRPTTSKYIRIYDGSTQVVTIDATSTSLVTYPSSNLGRSLTFRTTYNFVIGRSYNIRLDQGMASVMCYWARILKRWVIRHFNRCCCGFHVLWVELNSHH